MSRASNGIDKLTIDVTLSPNAVLPGFVRRSRSGGSCCFARCRWIAAEAWAFAFKAGLATPLVSLLVLVGEPFRLFGTNAVWSILTVGIMFEYTVGAVTSFVKQLPAFAPHEYRFRVILFTFCLIILSCYGVDNPIATALGRLYSIAMGAALALVNVLVFPAWAGEQLHRELVGSFTPVADTLDGELGKVGATAGPVSFLLLPAVHYVRVGAVLRHCAYRVVAMHGCLHSEIQAPHGIREAFQQEIKDAAAHAAELVRVLGCDVDGMVRSFERLSLVKRAHGSAYRLQLSLELNAHLLTSTPVVEASGCSLERSCSHNEGVRRQRSWLSGEVAAAAGGAGHVATRMRALESTAALSLATFASLLIEFVARLDHLVDTVDELSQLAKFREEERRVDRDRAGRAQEFTCQPCIHQVLTRCLTC